MNSFNAKLEKDLVQYKPTYAATVSITKSLHHFQLIGL